MREFDGELAQKIIDEMFLFENLVDVDDRSIQRLLQEVEDVYKRQLLLSERDEHLHLDPVFWGYAPGWWDKPPLINARVETAATLSLIHIYNIEKITLRFAM